MKKKVLTKNSAVRSAGNITRKDVGFSLLELIIAATIFSIFVLGAVKIYSLYTGSYRIRLEKNQVEQEKETVGSLIRPDFENAGFNLTGHQNHNYGNFPAAFSSNQRYQSLGNGEITRISSGARAVDYLESTTAIGSETGSVTATLFGETGIKLTGENGFYLELKATKDFASAGTYHLSLVNNEHIYELGEHTPGASYRISLVPDETGRAAIVSLLGRTEDEKRELVRTTENLPDSEISIAGFIQNTGDRLRVSAKGAPLIDRGASQILQNQLFIDNQTGLPVEENVYKTSDGKFTIIAGALDMRIGYLQEAAENFAAPRELIVSGEVGGGKISPGDFCLALDYQTGNSALLQVSNAIEDYAGRIIYSVSPATENNPAWGRFYSPDAALQSQFSRGTRFVKLSPPITYRLSDDQRLIRQVGFRPETVAFGVGSFNVAKLGGGTRYQIDLTIKSDENLAGGIGPEISYSYIATPRTTNADNSTE